MSLPRTHVAAVPQQCLKYLCIKVLIILVSITNLYGQQSGSGAIWPLRFHNSPWLEKGYLVRDEPREHYPEQFDPSRPKCDESSLAEYGRSSSSSCQAEGDCSFTPSQACIREIERRQDERKDETISIDRILAHNYVNPSQKIWPNKESGRKRTIPEKFEQCHYLTDLLITEMCTDDRQQVRSQLIERFRLRNCRRFSLEKALTNELLQQVIHTRNCSNILRELLVLDNLVEELACEYESILQRYDCDAKWSVKWSCKDCRLAYREWLCSNYIPYHVNSVVIKPCQSICEQVEQKCPHLHPYGKGQYAGEPVFLCIDPNIPFEPEITPNIPYGASEWCYDSCDLEPCLNEHGESPNVDCEYNLSATTTTTSAPLPEIEFDNGSTAPESYDPRLNLFENELKNGQNITFKENGFNEVDNPLGATSSMDDIELPASETTTEFRYDYIKNSIVDESAEIDFEQEVQSLPNIGNLADPEDGSSPLDSPTLPTILQNTGEGTTSRYPSWSSPDEDYNYIIQTGPIEAAKQSQSIQYLEMEPLAYKSSETIEITNTQPSSRSEPININRLQSSPEQKFETQTPASSSASSSSPITSTTETFQEIYDSALLPTLKPSTRANEQPEVEIAGTGNGNPQLESLKELTLPDEELRAVFQSRSGAVNADNWNRRNEPPTIYEPSTIRVDEQLNAGNDGISGSSIEPTTGSNHYRHSRSHRASNKNGKQQQPAAQKQVYQQQPEQQQQKERENRYSSIRQRMKSPTNSFTILAPTLTLMGVCFEILLSFVFNNLLNN